MNIVHYMKRHLSKPCGTVDTVGWSTDKCELSKLVIWDCLLCMCYRSKVTGLHNVNNERHE